MLYLRRKLAGVFFAFAFFLLSCHALQAQTNNNLVDSNFESPTQTYNPWGGVNGAGEIAVPVDSQLAVGDNGRATTYSFSPGVAAGDLNGDGLQDLVIADARGFFWYYPNHGTVKEPNFTYGEVMPIWLGSEALRTVLGSHAVVPRIYLTDVDGDGKPDILAGTYDGALFYLHNNGSPTQPVFSMQRDLETMKLATYKEGKLWCNYLSPCFVEWFNDEVYYLIMGEGTYSANSIYMLKNLGDRGKPIFNQINRMKIIPGMGREDLTPQVVDWNGDGKPDVICGERTGYIDLFLNTSNPGDTQPKFDTGTHLKIGGKENFGQLVVPCVADLNGNKLPNLLITSADGKITYAKNTGAPGSPKFDSAPVTLKGKNPYPDIYVNNNWFLNSPFGNSYELLVVTNATVEPGFTPPPDHKGKNALRAYVYPFTNTYFKTRYFLDPSLEFGNTNWPNEHWISYRTKVNLTEAVRYQVSFNVRTTGDVSATRFRFHADEFNPTGDGYVTHQMEKGFGASGAWNKITDSVDWRSGYGLKGSSLGFGFTIRWHGQGSIYLDDISIQPEQ